MIRRPPRSTPKPSSAASDVYKRQVLRSLPTGSLEPGEKRTKLRVTRANLQLVSLSRADRDQAQCRGVAGVGSARGRPAPAPSDGRPAWKRGKREFIQACGCMSLEVVGLAVTEAIRLSAVALASNPKQSVTMSACLPWRLASGRTIGIVGPRRELRMT